jgi:hypothetical protein
MKKDALHQLIKEEVEKVIGKYALKIHFGGQEYVLSMIEDDSKKVAAIKLNGENVATYKYDDEGVAQVSIANNKRLCDALAAVIYKFSKKPATAPAPTAAPKG